MDRMMNNYNKNKNKILIILITNFKKYNNKYSYKLEIS